MNSVQNIQDMQTIMHYQMQNFDHIVVYNLKMFSLISIVLEVVMNRLYLIHLKLNVNVEIITLNST
jgi:hypothetical protein